MIHIIQTNTSIDNGNKDKDFQSIMFKYSTWEEYKENLLNEDINSTELIVGTMMGNIKPKCCKIEKILINDDYHLECIINNGHIHMNVKAYKIDEDNFKNLL